MKNFIGVFAKVKITTLEPAIRITGNSFKLIFARSPVIVLGGLFSTLTACVLCNGAKASVGSKCHNCRLTIYKDFSIVNSISVENQKNSTRKQKIQPLDMSILLAKKQTP
jgi:hypothetical protein